MSEAKNKEVLLQADKLTRRFGGLVANQDISVTLERQMIHVLLGPNGAGKSTCINMLSGDLPPSEGKIHFMGKDITGLSAAQRSQVGIGRSYQRTNIFPQFSVLENVRLAAQSRRQEPWRIFSKAMEAKWALEKARACIDEAGLGKRVDWVSGVLSHGEQRQLEIAMVLATDAHVVSPLFFPGGDIGKLAVCGTVNDHHVTKAWAERSDALGKVDFIADFDGQLATALGLEVTIPGLGKRFSRFAMILDNGVVENLYIQDVAGVTVSGAPAILLALQGRDTSVTA